MEFPELTLSVNSGGTYLVQYHSTVPHEATSLDSIIDTFDLEVRGLTIVKSHACVY